MGLGSNNIDLDPLFVDLDGLDGIPGTADDNARLDPDSPCIDAGDNQAVPKGISTDLDGNDRFVDGDGDMTDTVDMGAYEFQGPPCGADLNNDGSVGASDLLILLAFWGRCTPGCLGDLNSDGTVGASDLLALLVNWGLPPDREHPQSRLP